MDLCGNTCGSSSSYSISAKPSGNHVQKDLSYSAIPSISHKKVLTFNNNLYSYDCSYELMNTSDVNEMNFESLFDDWMCSPGPTGPTGPTGPIGLKGSIGEMGLLGPTGPTGPGAMMYKNTIISLYSNQTQRIPTNGFIEFDNNHVIVGNSFHAPGSSEVWVWTPGLYLVYYNIYHVDPCQFALYKNDTFIVNGSSVGSIEGVSQSTITFVLRLGNDDCMYETGIQTPPNACKLQLINKSDTMVSLIDAESANNGLPQVSATISLVLLHK